MARRDLLELTVRDWLEALSSWGPAPAGGSAAALAGAMAAGLVAMTAQESRESWPEAPGIAAQALILRGRLAALVQHDADAYVASLKALGRADGNPDDLRDLELGAALDEAAAAPLRIAASSSDVAMLAGLAAMRARPDLHADAQAAATLAAAAAAAAARLVEVNLAMAPEDERIRRARSAAASAADAARDSVPPDPAAPVP